MTDAVGDPKAEALTHVEKAEGYKKMGLNFYPNAFFGNLREAWLKSQLEGGIFYEKEKATLGTF